LSVDPAPSTLLIRSPIDDSVVGAVSAHTPAVVDRVVRAARSAQRPWAALPVSERAVLLERIGDLLEERAGALADVLVREIAKGRKDARDEIVRSAEMVRLTAEEGKRLAGDALYGDSFPGFTREKIALTQRIPLGVVLAIPPFNYPINLAVSKIAPALVTGNAVVLKPPTQGAVAGTLLWELLREAGTPPGLVGLVTGRGAEIGDYLVTHPGVDMIAFTGSTETGRRIAGLSTMVPLLLELGGKDAAIVLEDADLDRTAADIVAGAFAYSGQRCTAVKRVLATDRTMDGLVERLLPAIERLKVGDPDTDAQVTPLISAASADYVQQLVDDAVAQGARVLAGNQRTGNLLTPTLVDDVTPAMRIAWEEPFGPVLPLIRVSGVEQAVELANRSEYGLQAAVFSRDIDAALQVASRLEVGTVQINGKTARGPDHFPFLGTKSSGFGTQGIAYALEAMTRLRAVVLNLRPRPDLARTA
jgi:glyceraldehyde-3-phosphate dehydrogenase (NADP+)